MDKKQQNVEDAILGYLGMTRQDIIDLAEEAESVFIYAAGEPDDEERSEGPDLDSIEDDHEDCPDDVDTYVSQIDMLSSAVDNTLGKLVIGTLQFENGREMLDTINAVLVLQDLKSK